MFSPNNLKNYNHRSHYRVNHLNLQYATDNELDDLLQDKFQNRNQTQSYELHFNHMTIPNNQELKLQLNTTPEVSGTQPTKRHEIPIYKNDTGSSQVVNAVAMFFRNVLDEIGKVVYTIIIHHNDAIHEVNKTIRIQEEEGVKDTWIGVDQEAKEAVRLYKGTMKAWKKE